MRESLSKTVQDVVRSANKTARQFNKDYVGTEHLLLAIARQSDTTGAKILEEHSVTPVNRTTTSMILSTSFRVARPERSAPSGSPAGNVCA